MPRPQISSLQLSYRSLKPEEKSFGVGIHGLAARVFGKKISNMLQKNRPGVREGSHQGCAHGTGLIASMECL